MDDSTRKTGVAGHIAPLAFLIMVLASAPATGDSLTVAEHARSFVHPKLRWPKDATFVGAGVAMIAGSRLMDVSVRPVPPEGFDPAVLSWSLDRDQVGKLSPQAADASDIASAASVAYPMVIALVSQPSGERFTGTLRRSVIYLESFLLATGTSSLIKNSVDRPRPYTYVPENQRQDPNYDVTKDEAFQSMPSSHASSSFCGAAFAMTDNLLTRPHASWPERVGVAFTGGFLAGMTSVLRVSAGKHFPSDVLAGGAIGMASGITVPLAHHYVTPVGKRGPSPSRGAWTQAVGGLLAGVGGGILAAQAFD